MMACHAMSGRVEEARKTCMLALQLDPNLRISRIKDVATFRRRKISKDSHGLPDRGRAGMSAIDAVDGSSTGTLVPWEVGGS